MEKNLGGRTLVAAHRGVSGGNIPCNTLAAYEIALRQGADIVELDVAISAEGGHYVFHPGMEPAHLRSEKYIKDMTNAEVSALRFVNQDGTPTEHGIATFDDTLEFLKGRCVVNVDKFWTDMPGIARKIRAHGMQDQVIIKTPAKREMFDDVEQYAPDMPYMPIISEKDECNAYLAGRRAMRYAGAEVVFADPNSMLASDEYIGMMHAQGRRLWINSILYDYRVPLAAGHSDDASLWGNADEGWGWMLDKGYDIIQTDWPGMLAQYINARAARK